MHDETPPNRMKEAGRRIERRIALLLLQRDNASAVVIGYSGHHRELLFPHRAQPCIEAQDTEWRAIAKTTAGRDGAVSVPDGGKARRAHPCRVEKKYGA